MEFNRSGMGNLYEKRDPQNHIRDDEPRALYWYAYRAMYEKVKNLLTPGELIPGDLPLCLMGNNYLRPDDFHLRQKDRYPIDTFIYPGKSLHIAFTDNIHEASGAIFDKDAKRQDCLYNLPGSEGLSSLGYYVYYVPHDNQPLHVRLVHQIHLDDPSADQVVFTIRKRVAELFSQYKIRC